MRTCALLALICCCFVILAAARSKDIPGQKHNEDEDLAKELTALANAVHARELARGRGKLSSEDIADFLAAGDIDPEDLDLDKEIRRLLVTAKDKKEKKNMGW